VVFAVSASPFDPIVKVFPSFLAANISGSALFNVTFVGESVHIKRRNERMGGG
jgi:hypothetical protein